jgi:hypothetical protein
MVSRLFFFFSLPPRTIKPKKKSAESASDEPVELKRTLGLVILRGDTIVSLSVEGPPPAEREDRGPGVSPRVSMQFYLLQNCLF